ncbi:MAG: outer membrane protein assembly factor BamB family protein [Pirellulaceae bacterium]
MPWLYQLVVTATAMAMLAGSVRLGGAAEVRPFSLIVMDPLAAQLSCPCVKGYARRDYQKLGDYLAKKLNRPVQVAFAASLAQGLEKNGGHADLVVGKCSVVLSDANRAGLKFVRVAALGNKDGTLTQHGLLVVRSDSSARTPADLKDFRLILGPADCDEKHAAARELLAQHGVEVPGQVETSEACSDGARIVVEAGPAGNVATVISSYAQPLLEGCGTIKKGDLLVIGQTKPIPFIVAFAAADLPDLSGLKEVLLATHKEPLIRIALESKQGFVAESGGERNESSAWPGWRGARRDARVSHLPETIPQQPNVVWEYPLSQLGLGGISATSQYVIVSDRDPIDQQDVFYCLRAEDGERIWSVRYLALGQLDYGNTPRATPLIDRDRVYLLGAFGHLHAVELLTGKVLWKKNIRSEFKVTDRLVWGVCSSPLLADGKLIINPGGSEASIVALDPANGQVIWRTAGRPAAFSSFVARASGAQLQLIGYDTETLGGWDARTGERLWELRPDTDGDFNVPTPVLVGDSLFVNTENNGGRLFQLDAHGRPGPGPVAHYDELTHDTHTPVVVGGRVLAVSHGLHCLDATTLQLVWRADDPAFQAYAALIASPERVLALSETGELLLLDPLADQLRILSRSKLSSDRVSVLSHPALVDSHLYVRLGRRLVCLALN